MNKPIYVFNGKDITNLFCFQVRDVVRIIARKELVTFPTAVGMFAASETYKIMREVENTLWAENAEYIADRYYEEMEQKNARKKELSSCAEESTFQPGMERSAPPGT